MGGVGWYWKRFQGAVDFINIATFYTAFRYSVMKKYTESTNLEMNFVPEDQRYKELEDSEMDMRELTRFFLDRKRVAGGAEENRIGGIRE